METTNDDACFDDLCPHSSSDRPTVDIYGPFRGDLKKVPHLSSLAVFFFPPPAINGRTIFLFIGKEMIIIIIIMYMYICTYVCYFCRRDVGGSGRGALGTRSIFITNSVYSTDGHTDGRRRVFLAETCFSSPSPTD